jgi:uncharacterized membrane protein
MRKCALVADERGASAVEFAITAPLFFLILAIIIECGLLLWTQLGLQHGSEMAARCAGVNKTTCGTVSAIQTYAVQQTFGLSPPPETFTITPAACGMLVSANYDFVFMTSYFGIPKLGLTAQACFPT